MNVKLLLKNNKNLGLLTGMILLFSVSLMSAATITSTTTGGTWATGSTWVGGNAPTATDDVIIATTGTGSVTLRNNATIVNVTINAGGILNGNFRLTIIGNFTNSGNFISGGEVRLSGTRDQNVQGFTTTGLVSMLKSGGIATFTGNVNGAGLTINGGGGTLNLGAGLSHTFSDVVALSAGTLNGGSSRINVNVINKKAWDGIGSLFIPASSTVNFGANGNQTISASSTTFYNLTFSFSGIKSLTSSNIINGTLSMEDIATTAGTIPNYGPAATLHYNRVSAMVVGQEWITPFSSSGGVTITNAGIITLNAAKVLNLSAPLIIDSGAKLDTNNFGLTFGGDFSNSGTFTAGSSVIIITNIMAAQTIAGFTTTGLISMTKTAGTATFTSAVKGAGLTLDGAGGTLNLGIGLSHIFTGDVALTAGTLNGGSSILNLNSASTTVWTGTGTNFNAATGTVVFGGSAQTLAAAATFNNLTFSNSGIKTLTAVPTVNGILSIEDSATASGAPVYGPTATLQYNRLASQVTGPEWTSTFAATGGVRIINTGIITTNAAKVFNSAVPLAIATGATLDNGGFAITGGATLAVDNGGALILSGSTGFPTFTTPTLGTSSTVEYNGADQKVAVKNYGNLILSGAGNKAFEGATIIAGNLETNGTAVAILPNGSVSTAYTFIIDGAIQSTGSWGGSASAATFKDATRFGSTTTGTCNVTNSCAYGYWLGTVNVDWNVAGNWCGGIPTATSSIVISSAPTNQPVIGISGGLCKNITINAGATLTVTGSNTLAVSGNWTNNGNFAANTGAVNFNGGIAQTIGGSSVTTFNNLTNSNSASSVTAQLDIIVKNILNISNAASVVDMSTNGLTDGGTFSDAGSGLLITSNTSATPIPVGQNWSNSVNYNNLTGGQTIVGGNYNGPGSLDLDNTSGTQTASGNISVGNQFNIDNGGTPTFNLAGFNLDTAILNINTPGAIVDMSVGNFSYSALVSMDGKIRFSALSNGLAIPVGTVEYYGGVQTVASGTYSNLLFSGVSGNYTVASDLNINNSLIITNGNVAVQNSVSLITNCAVTIVAPGALTFENNANLVQTSYTGPNSGNIIMKRDTSPIVQDDYTYWSSPTNGSQTLLNFSPDTRSDKYFDFNNNWANVNASSTVFAQGVGYNIRAPEGINASVATIYPFQFTGVPNNGTITVPVTEYLENGEQAGLRLIGNPYPSALDANAFIDANVAAGTITGTLYFWTHNHRLNGNDYVASDYATYSLFGGTGVRDGSGNLADPTQYIPTGQGFFIENDITGNILFNNTMRIGAKSSNFYKIKSTKAVELHRIWFSLSNGTSNTSQALVGYATGATNGYDPGYDSYVYDYAQAFSLYSFIGANKMAIQARALPFVDTDTVPLGYSINVAGNATLTVYKYDGLFDETQNIYIEDKLFNVIHNIKATPYNFTSQAGTFDNRFVLRYTDKTLGVNDVETTLENQVLVSNKDKKISISSFAGPIDKTMIFDATGRILYQKTNVDSKELKILELVSSKQLLLVKVVLQDGKSITKKIIY
jgi:hypothetical protein